MTPPNPSRQEAARRYLAQGWAVIPVPARSKNAGRTDWQLERWTEADVPTQFRGDGNLSLLPGTPSLGIGDVDVDCAEALLLADHLLPPSDCRFGRVTTPGSHRLFQVTGAFRTLRFQDPLAPKDERDCLVELRGPGAHTLLPPSVYPEGDACVWHADGEPASVAADVLIPAVHRLAAASLLVRYWPGQGSRHDTTLALAGGLVHLGWRPEEVARFVELIAWAAGDEEVNDRVAAARSTLSAHVAGQPTTGWPRLAQLLPPPVVQRVRTWLATGTPPRSSDPNCDDGDGRDGRDDPARGGSGSQSGAPAGRGPAQATVLVELAHDTGAEFFHTAEGDVFATVPLGDHWETWPLRSKSFRHYLSHAYFLAHGRAPGSQALKDAGEVLAGEALFVGPEYEVAVRLAHVGGVIYLDLGNAAWQVIRITATGWSVMAHTDAPIRFRRPKGLLPLPMPIRGGSVELFRYFVNGTDDTDWVLVVGWLLGCFYPVGPRAILHLLGEQGSAKSTLARLLRSLIDPNKVPLRTQPRDEGDLLIAATNGAVVALDNLSEIPRWLSDALCRMATGGGLSKRELFTDADEILLDAQRPVLLTAITEIATASDLLDRCVTVVLTPIPPERRRTEAAMEQAFMAVQPKLLGALLDAVCCGLSRVATLQLDRSPRLADFATWVEAAVPALGWQPGLFLDALEQNRQTADAVAIEAVPVGVALLTFMRDREQWQGTPHQLLSELSKRVSAEVQRDRSWPKQPNRLSGQLRRLAPNLRRLGLEVHTSRQGGSGQRLVTLTKNSAVWDRHHRHDRHGGPEPAGEVRDDAAAADRHATVTDRHGDHHSAVETRPLARGKQPECDGCDSCDDTEASSFLLPMTCCDCGETLPPGRHYRCLACSEAVTPEGTDEGGVA